MSKEDEKFELSKEISEMLGFDSEFESKDAFKTKFEEKFIAIKNIDGNKEILDPIFGKLKGSVETKLKSSFKKLGIEFESDDIKGKKLEEIIELGVERVETAHTTKFDEFKNSFEGDGKEEIEKLQKTREDENTAWKLKYGELEGLRNDLKTELENSNTKHTTDLKQRDLDLLNDKAYGSIKWARDSEGFDLKFIGFKANMKEKYGLELDDDKNLIPTDKEGKRITSADKVGEFEKWEAILEKEAKEANILKINPKGGKPFQANGNLTLSDDDKPVRHITMSNR